MTPTPAHADRPDPSEERPPRDRGDGGCSPSSRLARRLGKAGPFASIEQEVFFNLIRAHEAVTVPFDRLFRARGVSMPLYNILRILRGHASAGGEGLAIQRIAEQMLTREPDMTRLIDRLQRGGLVERRRSDEDRRVVLVRITDAGRALLASLDEPVAGLHRATLSHLDRGDLATLNALLFRTREGLETTDDNEAEAGAGPGADG